jgi:hypothetical protein
MEMPAGGVVKRHWAMTTVSVGSTHGSTGKRLRTLPVEEPVRDFLVPAFLVGLPFLLDRLLESFSVGADQCLTDGR